jgi:hypothetical protein
MAQLDNRIDKELKAALDSGQLGPSKSAFAEFSAGARKLRVAGGFFS